MKKITTLILFICISAFGALNLSTKSFAAVPNSYETLVENKEIKKITYSCVFDNKKYAYPTCKFEERCETGSTCFKVNDLDYVSFFVSYNFVNAPFSNSGVIEQDIRCIFELSAGSQSIW